MTNDKPDFFFFELEAKLTEAAGTPGKKRKITGIAALPRVSKNGYLYLPEELAALDGKTAPVLYRHTGTPERLNDVIPDSAIVGSATVHYNKDTWQLTYDAEVDLPASLLESGSPLGVSIGAFANTKQHVCGSKYCYGVPRDIRLVELSIVPNAGIPETTVKLIENFEPAKQCKCYGLVSSDSPEQANSKAIMTDNEVKKVAEVKPEVNSTQATTAVVTTEQFTEGIKSVSAEIATQFKNSQQIQLDKLTEAIGALRVIPKAEPSSPVSDTAAKPVTPQVDEYKKVVEWFSGVKRGGSREYPGMAWSVDLDYYLKQWGYNPESDLKKLREDVTYASPPQGFVKKAFFIPGGRMKVPVRQYVDFKALSGENVANWYTFGAVDFGAITEGSAPSAVSQTITQKTATPSVRGAFQKVKYSQIEDQPFDLVATINMSLALAAIDDEANDLLNTVYAAITPTNWVRADTGAAVTTDDVASLVFKREGLMHAKKLIGAQGYDISPGNLVLFLAPKQYTELMLDTNLNNFYQYARPEITATGLLEQIYGVDIVVADQVELKDQTNDTYRAILAVKGQWAGIASARDVQMEASRRNELQQVYLTATHRVKSVILDEKATARISSSV